MKDFKTTSKEFTEKLNGLIDEIIQLVSARLSSSIKELTVLLSVDNNDTIWITDFLECIIGKDNHNISNSFLSKSTYISKRINPKLHQGGPNISQLSFDTSIPNCSAFLDTDSAFRLNKSDISFNSKRKLFGKHTVDTGIQTSIIASEEKCESENRPKTDDRIKICTDSTVKYSQRNSVSDEKNVNKIMEIKPISYREVNALNFPEMYKLYQNPKINSMINKISKTNGSGQYTNFVWPIRKISTKYGSGDRNKGVLNFKSS